MGSRSRALWAALSSAGAILVACRGPALAGGDGGAPIAGAVTAVVVSVKTSLESAMYLSVKTEFRNASSAPVTVWSYAIEWPQGRFVGTDVAMVVAPGSVASRIAQVGADHGPLDRLTVSSAHVVILEAR